MLIPAVSDEGIQQTKWAAAGMSGLEFTGRSPAPLLSPRDGTLPSYSVLQG